MTIQELNRDIKRLAKACDKQDKSGADYINCKTEFIRLEHAADDYSKINKNSLLILIRLNLQHRFIALHTFGLRIKL